MYACLFFSLSLSLNFRPQEVRLDLLSSRKAHTALAHSSSAGELNVSAPGSPPDSSTQHLTTLSNPHNSQVVSHQQSTGGGGVGSMFHSSVNNQMQLSQGQQRPSNYGSVNRLNLIQQTTRGEVVPATGGAGASSSNINQGVTSAASGPGGAGTGSTSVNIPKHLNELFGVSPSDIDKYSRVVFPVCFVCFNLMYWMIYLHISKILEDDFIAVNSD